MSNPNTDPSTGKPFITGKNDANNPNPTHSTPHQANPTQSEQEKTDRAAEKARQDKANGK